MRTCSSIKKLMLAVFALATLLVAAPASAQTVLQVDKLGDHTKFDPVGKCSEWTPNDCQLRDAVAHARYWVSEGQAVTITFDPALVESGPQTIETFGPLDWLIGDITIVGPGRQLTVDGTFSIAQDATVNISRLTIRGQLYNAGRSLTLNDVTLKDVNGDITGGLGGAIHNEGGLSLQNVSITDCWATSGAAIYNAGGPFSAVSLIDVSLANNAASSTGGAIYNAGAMEIVGGSITTSTAKFQGGGIYNTGSLTIMGASIRQNLAAMYESGGLGGGGIWNSGTLTIRDTELTENVAPHGGAGLLTVGGNVVIERSLIALNRSTVRPGFEKVDSKMGAGAGILNDHGTMTIVSSTFFGNEASAVAGALLSAPKDQIAGTVDIAHSTFLNNIAGTAEAPGAGIAVAAGSQLRLKDSIVAGSGLNCIGSMAGYGNVDTADPVQLAGACPGAAHTTVDALHFTPEAAPLAHGGPTRSLAIGAGSAAIDAATECTDWQGHALNVDQTGYAIPYGGACDAGAYEYRPADTDRDGVGDDTDNCPSVANPVQFDLDHDGRGDECDDDRDGDGVTNETDASPESDRQCSDTDHDSCDDCASGRFNPADDGPDNDGDGICNAGDNDLDTDGDGIQDLVDAFPYDRNACGDSDQDSCDDCSVLARKDASNDGPDSDGDGVCNAGETDDDSDGVLDAADNCPTTPNAEQVDLNRNGLGDACDTNLYNEWGLPSNLRNVSATGTFVSMANEYVSEPIAIGFEFWFYGKKYSTLRISSNGFVTFANSENTGCCQGSNLPGAGGPNNLIAGYWEDLLPPYAEGLGGQVRYQTLGAAPSRQFVVGFYDVSHSSPTGNDRVTFEIILHEQGGRIEFQYGNLADDRDGIPASAGIENGDGTVGWMIGGRPGEKDLADFLMMVKGFLLFPNIPAPVDSDGDGANDDEDHDDDNDGIADGLDRNKATGADESHVSSSDYRKDDATFGTVTRNGWTVSVVDGAGGVEATISGNGSSPALISACDGRAKQIVLSTASEAARWRCESSSIVVDAIAASPRIEVEKLYCVGASCGWKVSGKLSTGQHLTTGSPWTAGDSSTIPVTIVAPDGTEVGSLTLDPNETADVQIGEAPDGGASVQVDVLNGSVTVSAFGQTQTLDSSSGAGTFTADTEPPAVTCSTDAPSLWPANHKLVAVTATIKIDGVVSVSGFTLKSVTSSEPDNGLGDGDTAGDIQGWTLGTADASGFLRAERSGKGSGRTYTLTFEGRDSAGNVGTCAATVVVPQSGGKK